MGNCSRLKPWKESAIYLEINVLTGWTDQMALIWMNFKQVWNTRREIEFDLEFITKTGSTL
jgi:hypothetical protein